MNNFCILVLCILLHMTYFIPQCASFINSTQTAWKCNNQEQIAKEKVCDGRRDCSDGSDETALTCVRRSCAATQYRCAYGACIPAAAKCDKRPDCADQSDETRFACIDDVSEVLRQLQGQCSNSQMQCSNGQCIADILRCDGKRDCDDGSDESVTICSSFNCPQYAFRCGYGGCIPASRRCDGTRDCVDGSDEFCAWRNLYKSRSMQHTRSRRALAGKTCIIPFDRRNLRVTLRDGQSTRELQRGDTVPKGKYIHFECLYKFRIEGVTQLMCENNGWYKQWPKCVAAQDQQACKKTQWRCSSGECIEKSAICNGSKDCQDASDETVQRCIAKKCGTHEFRCAYGACVASASVCNGANDCADGSDETKFLCAKDKADYLRQLRGTCDNSSLYMQCTSGECIEEEYLCDGLAQCADASDESVVKCGHMKCPPYAFRCGYGGCIRYTAACDGIANCDDESDELPAVCKAVDANAAAQEEEEQAADDDVEIEYLYSDESDEYMEYLNFSDWIALLEAAAAPNGVSFETRLTSSAPLTVLLPDEQVPALKNKCSLPLNRPHLLMKDATTNRTLLAGNQVEALTVVQFYCEADWQLVDGDTEALCMEGGDWTSTPPKCDKYCDNFAIARGLSTSAKCYYNQQSIDCMAPLRTGSVAQISCASGYQRKVEGAVVHPARRSLTCDADGEWDYAKIQCAPQCVDAVEYKSEQTVMPYNVNIYKRVFQWDEETPMRRTLECSGAIITPKIIISTVICFSKTSTAHDAANDPTLYEVVVAANVADYDAQRAHNVSEILIMRTDINAIDIPAAVVLTDFIVMSATVKPICLNFQKFACFEQHMKDENAIELAPDAALSPKRGAITAVSNGENRKCLALMGEEVPIALNHFELPIKNQIMRYNYLL